MKEFNVSVATDERQSIRQKNCSLPQAKQLENDEPLTMIERAAS
jgi:hypothetical protein